MKKGFTLIELLTTMAIIAVLATISLFALQGSRESARDARRKSDLEAIRQALELYRADCGTYASALTSPLSSSCSGSSVTYMETIPTDPSTDSDYPYCPNTTNYLNYSLYSHLENNSGMSIISPSCGACDPTNCYYQVKNF